MVQNIGYLLPEGDAYTDELACLMLFYPDKPEYRRALFGALDYFGTWLAWERDVDKRGKDAARAWAEAIAATRECLSMNTCELLLAKLDRIIALHETCCVPGGDYITYNENIVVTTVIVPGSGDPPDYWGEQAVADWDEWLEYVCGQAHALVDDIINTIDDLEIAGTITGYVLDFIAHLFSLVQWRMVEDLIPVNFSLIQAIVNALGEGLLAFDFDQARDDVEDAREDIVCSLILGTSVEDEIETALSGQAGVLWSLFFDFIDWETTTAAIYKGEIEDVGYLPVIQADTCSGCGIPDLPAGASSYPIEIVSVSSPTVPGSGWTLHELSTDGTSVFFDVTKATDSGAYCYLDIVVAASPYWGVPGASHRGIVYHGVRYTHGSGEAMRGEPAFLQDTVECGRANNVRWYLMCSSPYGGYAADLETYMGVSFYDDSGTHGLDQNPDQNRTLRLRFWWKDINESNYRAQMYVGDLHWAINKT